MTQDVKDRFNRLATRYKSAKIVESLAKLRGCLSASLEELRDEPGTHAKWKAVSLGNRGKWVWYELPDAGRAKK